MARVSLPFDRQCDLAGLPRPIAEYRFAKHSMGRKWAADYGWPDQRVLLEVEGGFFVGGRHSRGAGALKDMEKYNAAALLGYRLLRVTPRQIDNGEALTLVDSILRGKVA